MVNLSDKHFEPTKKTTDKYYACSYSSRKRPILTGDKGTGFIVVLHNLINHFSSSHFKLSVLVKTKIIK